jgi:sarcosine oxidase, subunit delta
MFVITCPHCQEAREEEEFHYEGEAFIARPSSPEAETDEAWGDYLFTKKNPKGWHWEMQHRQPHHCRQLDTKRSAQSL